LPEVITKLGLCQVRSKTESPCPRGAEVEILGVAFCEPCARQQEAYFAIGELTHEDGQDLRSKPLAEVLLTTESGEKIAAAVKRLIGR
jgi:hypothetical protein